MFGFSFFRRPKPIVVTPNPIQNLIAVKTAPESKAFVIEKTQLVVDEPAVVEPVVEEHVVVEPVVEEPVVEEPVVE